MVKVTCYDGVNTIGGNKVVLQDGDSALMLDFGKSFSAMGSYFDTFLQPRTNSAIRDLIRLNLLPAIPGIYRGDLLALPGAWDAAQVSGAPATSRGMWQSNLESYEDYVARYGRPRIDGVLISHGHTDHFQHVAFLAPEIPLYGSAITSAILRAVQETGAGGCESDIWICPERICGENGKTSTFPGAPKIDRGDRGRCRTFCAIEPFTPTKIGAFVVEAVPVDHSVPGAYSYIITCPSGKTVFYTGDLRFHGRLSLPPYDISARLRERTRSLKPDMVITEGTRITDSAGDDEGIVEANIRKSIGEATGLAIVDFGWKDTTRFETILSVARATNRVIAISPKLALLWEYMRTLEPDRYHDLSSDPNVKVYIERRNSMLYSLSDYSDGKFIAGPEMDWGERAQGMRQAYAVDDEDYLSNRLKHYRDGVRAYDVSDNPSKYILHAGYYDMNELFDVNPPRGSVFIKAATEPFNAEMEQDEKRLGNWLTYFGLMTEGEKVTHSHVSGHANGDDLCRFLTDMEPKSIVPIHTEHPEVYVERLDKVCEVLPPSKGQELTIP